MQTDLSNYVLCKQRKVEIPIPKVLKSPALLLVMAGNVPAPMAVYITYTYLPTVTYIIDFWTLLDKFSDGTKPGILSGTCLPPHLSGWGDKHPGKDLLWLDH